MEAVLNLLNMKRALQILDYLGARGPRRTSEIGEELGERSTTQLARPLKRLEEFGLVTRGVDRARHVTNELTPLGRSLMGELGGLRRWVNDHESELDAARDRYYAAELGLPESGQR